MPTNYIKVTDTTLANGIRLIDNTNPISPTVSVFGSVETNSALQTPAGRDGLDDLLNELFSYGTQSPDYRTARALDVALLPAGDPALRQVTPATVNTATLDQLKHRLMLDGGGYLERFTGDLEVAVMHLVRETVGVIREAARRQILLTRFRAAHAARRMHRQILARTQEFMVRSQPVVSSNCTTVPHRMVFEPTADCALCIPSAV